MMSPRRFKPSVEQLERRLMLSVTTSMTPGIEATAMAYEPPAEIAEDAHSSASLEYTVTIEDDADGHVLVVNFKNLDRSIQVGIEGGDKGWTDPNGTVRLQQPSDIREIVLRVGDEQGDAMPFVQLEFDATGHIVRQVPLEMKTSDAAGDNFSSNEHGRSLVGLYTASPGHSVHSSAMNGVATANSASSSNSSHQLAPSMVDEAMVDHAGMSGMSAWAAGGFGSGHVTATDDAQFADASETIADNAQAMSDMVASNMAEMGSASAPQESMQGVVFASGTDELPEAVLVGWFESEEADSTGEAGTAELIATDVAMPILPQATVEILAMATSNVSADELLPVFENHTWKIVTEDQPAGDESQDSTWLMVGSILLAISTATGACILERRASRVSKLELPR